MSELTNVSKVVESELRKKFYLGVTLIVVGIILLIVVFVKAYAAFEQYNLEINTGGDTAQILNVSAQVLINLLVKIAFLGVALAAGSIILGKGVSLLKRCPEK